MLNSELLLVKDSDNHEYYHKDHHKDRNKGKKEERERKKNIILIFSFVFWDIDENIRTS